MNNNERIEALLALILIRSFKDENNKVDAENRVDAMEALSVAGFTNVEIANLFQTSAQTVTQSLYERRKKASPRKLQKKSR
ncbi:hypothetical protein AMJ49_02945 [Parcubacteria bacterium DG_74_2]|nr:MAG: hypothetical protein AMJ49_02945 [Parcubacteria bacterium DG_74_2]